MMQKMMGAVVLVWLVGCSSSDDTPEVGSGHGTCGPRSGSFIAHYTLRPGGTCPPLPDAVVNVTADTAAPAGCTGTPTNSADNCEVLLDQTCPSDAVSKGGTSRVTGQLKWNVVGTYGEGTETLYLTNGDGSSICVGTYDTTVTRQ